MTRTAEYPPIESSDRFRSAPRYRATREPDWPALLQRLTPDAGHNVQQLVEFACERLDSEGGLYLNPAPASKTGLPQAHAGLPSSAIAEVAAIQGAAHAHLQGRIGALAVESAEDTPWLSGLAHRLGVKSALFCPVHLATGNIGLLAMMFKAARRFQPRDLEELGALANAIALEHIRAAADGSAEHGRGDTLRRTLVRLERASASRKTLRARIRKLEADLRQSMQEKEELKYAIGNLHRKHGVDTAERDQRTIGRLRALVDAPLSKLKASALAARQMRWLEMIEQCLRPTAPPLEAQYSSGYYHLTPTEIKVATLIKQNRTNKEIGEMLDISTRTVEVHRNNIRRKFGIRNKDVNLRTHLLTLE